MISKDAGKLIIPTTYAFGEFKLEAENLLLLRNSEVVPLAPKAVEVLLMLIEADGKLLRKQQILDKVWADTFVEEANLTHHISVLRKVLGEDKTGRRFIETIPRRGYRFVAEVRDATVSKNTQITLNERTTARYVEESEIVVPDGAELIQANDSIVILRDTPKALPETKTIRSWRKNMWLLSGFCLILVTGAMTARYYWNSSGRPAFLDNSIRANWQVTTVLENKNAALGNIEMINFAPDGKSIAFSRIINKKGVIYVKQIGGGEPIKLTDGNWLDTSPVWLADGQRVAFLSDRDKFQGVWTMPFMGGTPALLKRLNFPLDADLKLLKISSGGDKIFFTVNDELFSIGSNESEPARLANLDGKFQIPDDFSISPDDSRFAFIAKVVDEFQVFTCIIGAESAEPQQITHGGGVKRAPFWFADGHTLLYSSDATGNFQIYAIPVAGGEPVQLTLSATDNSNPIISSDNRSIIYQEIIGGANVYSYSFDTQTETAQTNGTDLKLFPSVSLDGNNVAFQATDSAMNFFASRLKIISLDEEARILDIADNGFNPRWSPAGNALAFVRSDGTATNLWKVSNSGQNETQITRSGINLAGFSLAPFNFDRNIFEWSPDGSQIAFVSSKSGAPNVWTIAADGSSETKWTNNEDKETMVRNLSWSPKGNRLAFSLEPKTGTVSGSFTLFTTDGKRTETLSGTKNLTRILGWTKEGHEVFTAEEENNIETSEKTVIINRISTSGAARTLARLSAAEIKSVSLSPDSENIIFTTAANAQADNIYLLPLTGSEIRQSPHNLTNNQDKNFYYSGVVWSMNNRMIFYSKQLVSDAYTLLTINQ